MRQSFSSSSGSTVKGSQSAVSFAATVLALSSLWIPQEVHGASLVKRQYPADAPTCASVCIRAKIQEAADPGLATACDRSEGQSYITCLCSTGTFTRAYDTCLTQNCGFPDELSTARSLFQSFCTSPSQDQIDQAHAIASAAVASQASFYATRSGASSSTTLPASSGLSTTSLTASTTSPAVSSGLSSTTTLATSGRSSAATTSVSGSSSITTLPSSAPTSGVSTGTSTGASNSASQLGAAGIASARANATGVNAGSSTYGKATQQAGLAIMASVSLAFLLLS